MHGRHKVASEVLEIYVHCSSELRRSLRENDACPTNPLHTHCSGTRPAPVLGHCYNLTRTNRTQTPLSVPRLALYTRALSLVPCRRKSRYLMLVLPALPPRPLRLLLL